MNVFEQRRAEFAAALRSGEYTQGKHMLKRRTKTSVYHCVWGVGCEIYKEHHPDTSNWEDALFNYGDVDKAEMFSVGDGHTFKTSPPTEVRDYFGFTDKAVRTMMSRNDQMVSSFSGLADFVESYKGNWYAGN